MGKIPVNGKHAVRVVLDHKAESLKNEKGDGHERRGKEDPQVRSVDIGRHLHVELISGAFVPA